MDNEQLLTLYLEKLKEMTQERLDTTQISVLEALKEALVYLEGEMTGY